MTGELARTQLSMQAAMTSPWAGAEAAGALVNSSPLLAAEHRLELYRRTYHRRLTGCLRETYPALLHALGDDLFDDFAGEYLAAHPPHGTSLASLGAAFPEYLEATRPDLDLPPEQREHWPDFLVDLARLERLFWEVYDGPGAEGISLPRAVTDLPGLRELDPATGSPMVELGKDVPGSILPSATLEPVASLHLLRASHPVEAYLTAVRRGEHPAVPSPCERFIAVSRRDFVVALTRLGTVEHALLAGLVGGGEIREMSATLGLHSADTWRLLSVWVERGWLVAIRPTRGASS